MFFCIVILPLALASVAGHATGPGPHSVSAIPGEPDEIVALILDRLKHKDPAKRAEAARDLSSVGGERAINALICTLRSDDDIGVRTAAIRSLGGLKEASKKAIPLLVEVLRDESTLSPFRSFQSKDLNAEAAQALSEIGPESAVPLMQVARDKKCKSVIRLQAVDAIWFLEEPKPEAIEPGLIALTTDQDEDLRMRVIEILPAALPKSHAVKRALLASLADESHYIQVLGAAALFQHDPENVISVPVLIHLLKDQDDHVRWRALTELGSLGAKAKSAVKDILPHLRSNDEWLRMAAVRALGRIGPDAQEAVPQLRVMLKDTSGNVRSFAQESLDKITKKPK